MQTNSILCECVNCQKDGHQSIQGFFKAPRGRFSSTNQDEHGTTLLKETVENDTKIGVAGLAEKKSFTQLVHAKELA